MADFVTHLATSSVLGAGYGAAAYAWYDVPVSTSLLAGGLCGVCGMLPDLDSGSGRPLRESVTFAAAVVPMMLLERLRTFGLTPELLVLIGAGSYLLIRFGLGWLLKHFTTHRGMFHSLPAAGVFFLIAFLLASGQEVALRWYKAGGVLLGYLSHLVLDELYSLEWVRGRWKLRRSFGTALKLWGSHVWANLLAYGLLGLLVVVVFFEPAWMEKVQRRYIEAQAQFWESQRQRLAALDAVLTQPHSRSGAAASAAPAPPAGNPNGRETPSPAASTVAQPNGGAAPSAQQPLPAGSSWPASAQPAPNRSSSQAEQGSPWRFFR
jgi:membrane-bound metal-dependent hydrolase YbcI (DUF457 family)